MRFIMDDKSIERLKYVHPDLASVVQLAYELSHVKFKVTEGLRTIETQRKYVATGRSQTMSSYHLAQADGYSHAVDLAAFPDGQLSWDLEYYYDIADAMDNAADALGVCIKWGAAWNTTTEEFDSAREAANSYIKERKKLGRKVFIDAVHFQIEV